MSEPIDNKPMTVGQLRAALVGLPDDMTITVRASDDDADVCGAILSAGTEHAHDEDNTLFFAIDASGSEDDFELDEDEDEDEYVD